MKKVSNALLVGHLGVSFYFIVSGTLTVQREEKDRRTSEKHIQVFNNINFKKCSLFR